MNASFRIMALPHERFANLFALSDEDLRALGACRLVVDEKPGYPCRVSLVDAEVGETVLLTSFTHHDVDSPYRGSGPVYVRAGARTADLKPGEVPQMLRHRVLSIRAYDAEAMLVRAEVVQGSDLESAIERLFASESIRYLDIHNAGPGCYNCRAVRV